MPSSGVTSFSVTETEIIQDAFETAGIADPQAGIDPADYATARRKLNMLVKQWASQIDFAPGLKMWTRRRGYLFLQQNQVEYSVGPSGDHATESYVSTTLAANAANGASTVTVSSATGLSSGMYIAVKLSTGALHWTTINGAPAGAVVTLTAVLTASALSGARVFAYTTKVRRPFELETVSLRDTDSQDTPMDGAMTLPEYEAIASKTSEGTPSRVYFEAQRTNAKVFLDCAPSDATNVIRLGYLSYVEDFTQTTDTVDFPAEWYRALSAQLALDLCPAFQRPITPDMKILRDEALSMARRAYPLNVVSEYQSDPDDY
jgi:hypothetical protein